VWCIPYRFAIAKEQHFSETSKCFGGFFRKSAFFFIILPRMLYFLGETSMKTRDGKPDTILNVLDNLLGK